MFFLFKSNNKKYMKRIHVLNFTVIEKYKQADDQKLNAYYEDNLRIYISLCCLADLNSDYKFKAIK